LYPRMCPSHTTASMPEVLSRATDGSGRSSERQRVQLCLYYDLSQPPNGFRESYQTASLLSQASKNRVDATSGDCPRPGPLDSRGTRVILATVVCRALRHALRLGSGTCHPTVIPHRHHDPHGRTTSTMGPPDRLACVHANGGV
jgi:hypothetical protein